MIPDKKNIGSYSPKLNISKSTIGLRSLIFLRHITKKHLIFRKFDSTQTLTFRKIVGIKNGNNSLHSGPFNKCIYSPKFTNLINKFQNSFSYVSDSVSPIYRKNILISANPVMLCYLQGKLNFEFSGSKNRINACAKSRDKSSTSIHASTQEANKSSTRSTNSVVLNYFYNKSIGHAGLRTDRKMPIQKIIEIPSANKSGTTQNIKKTLLWHRERPLEKTRETPLASKYGATQVIDTTSLRQAKTFMADSSKTDRIFNSKNGKKTPNIISAHSQENKNDGFSYQQTRSIIDPQPGDILNHDSKFKKRDLFPAFQRRRILKGSIYSSLESLFPDNGFADQHINSKYVNQFMSKNRLPEVNEDLTYNPGELVLKRPFTKKKEIAIENKGETQPEKIAPREIQEENRIKGLNKERTLHEIEMIADRVYRIIEKRISIEKDRRGLF